MARPILTNEVSTLSKRCCFPPNYRREHWGGLPLPSGPFCAAQGKTEVVTLKTVISSSVSQIWRACFLFGVLLGLAQCLSGGSRGRGIRIWSGLLALQQSPSTREEEPLQISKYVCVCIEGERERERWKAYMNMCTCMYCIICMDACVCVYIYM